MNKTGEFCVITTQHPLADKLEYSLNLFVVCIREHIGITGRSYNLINSGDNRVKLILVIFNSVTLYTVENH